MVEIEKDILILDSQNYEKVMLLRMNAIQKQFVLNYGKIYGRILQKTLDYNFFFCSVLSPLYDLIPPRAFIDIILFQ